MQTQANYIFQNIEKERLKPTILIITELFPYEDNSFVGTFVVNQIKALKKNYNFVIIVPRFFGFSIKKQIFKQQDNIKIYYIRQYSFFLLASLKLKILKPQTIAFINKIFIRKKILKLSKKLHKKYNFSLVHGHESYIGDEAGHVGNKLHIPSIVTIHGLYEYHKLGWGEKVMQLIIKNLNKSNKILAVSRIALNSYQKNGLRNEKNEIIPNILNKQEAGLLPVKWRNIIENKKVILTVGFFTEAKRIEQVIYAFVELRKKYQDSFILLIIGRGKLETFYKKIIKDNNLENQVYIIGEVAPNKIMSYFQICDFLVHPSIVDSFSMTCLEAMSAGKPFICTQNIGITEYIKNNQEAFIVPPNDLNELTKKMDTLLINSELRKKMGRLAYQTSLKFQDNNLKHKLFKIYEEFIEIK